MSPISAKAWQNSAGCSSQAAGLWRWTLRPPPKTVLLPFIRFHLHTVIPSLGRLLTGQADAYQYLPDSTENFLEPNAWQAGCRKPVFKTVVFAA